MRISDWSSDVCSSDLRQRIDAGIEHPDAAFPDPFLPRMPDAHVLLPRDRDAADRAIGEPGECGLDRGGLARMPGGVEHDIARRRRLGDRLRLADRSEEHTSELQSLMRISYAVFCLKKKKED